MGIPKFYRWLSERYPVLNMPVTATEAPPEIDNLYLDMNGIIHNCTHANDPNLKLTETEMVLRIFNYLDKLIQIMKPKQLVFLAIDGVAPRAKMNQQRSRRFKSALERLAREAEQKAKGDETPEEFKFDSNCITPGTAFMARLGKHLRFFIRKKISEDTTWQQPVVIFSGHDVPGEGEHKIMEYIRWQKRSPAYTPNQRHCMYGLDADLIMLSLVTHEPHFCLLREVVSFSGKNRGQPARETLENPCAESFILFQIGLLREYIELEFAAHPASKQLSFPLDVERLIDDIVLFCMLVGNDFLPALPTLDIAEGALNQLIERYKHLLPRMGGYLTNAGELNHERLQMLLGVLADAELQTLEERAADTEWFENKRSKRGGRGRSTPGPSNHNSRPQTAASGTAANPLQPQQNFTRQGFQRQHGFEGLDDLEELSAAAVGFSRTQEPVVAALASVVPAIQGLELEELEPDEAETGPTMMSKEARAMFLNGGGEAALQTWKERYYREKLEVADASPQSTRGVVGHYIKGLHWVLQYYYRGVASWDWFYPYHYAPMASDMRTLDGIAVNFNRGTPFKPFEQLLAVLPAASATLLPQPFQWLMTDPNSPILDFYPEKFDVDMEGKRAEWEGIVKVPFIEEQRLLAAAASIPLNGLTTEERKCNIPGDILVFEFTAGRHEPEHCDTTLPHHFGTILHAHSMCRRVPPPEAIPSGDRGFIPALSKGTLTGKRNPPGFPTLKTMSNLNVELKMAGVAVFANPSKKDTLVLQLPDVQSTIAADAAAPLLRGMLCGRVYVKWPYLQEAEIMAVSDARQRMSVEGITQHTQEAAGKWQMIAGQTKNMFLTKSGIDIGPLPIMLDVRVCTGYVQGADGAVQKRYAKELAPYPLQAVLQSRPKPPPGFADPDAPKQLSLQPGSKVIWVGANYFGCVGNVLADPAAKVSGRSAGSGYLVRLQPLHRELMHAEGRAKHIVQQYAQDFCPSGAACRMLRVNPRMLGKLTGNVWVDDSRGERVDIGLAVKNAKQGLCVPSLCRPAPEGTGWSYSTQLIEVVREYKSRFPSVLAALEPAAAAADGSLEGGGDQRQSQRVTAAALFPGVPADQLDQKLEQVRSWLKSLPSTKRPLVSSSAQQASDAAVDRLQMTLPGLLPVGATAVGPVELEAVHPSLLLPPHDPAMPVSVLAAGPCEPGDRVVVLRGTGAPPFGARGTVIGVLPDGLEVLMDEEYAGGSTLSGRLRSPRGAYLPAQQILNVSKQQPVRGAGQRPRPAAAASTRRSSSGSQDPAAAAGGGDVQSPRTAAVTSATRLVALAPWMKGRPLQHHNAAAPAADQQQDGAAAAPAGTPGVAAAAASVPVAPTTQGTRLLQMLKKHQQPAVAAPGPIAAIAAPAGTPLPQQGIQQQQQQAALPAQQQQQVGGSLKAALQAAAKAQQQQQGPALPTAPDAATGRSLLHKLQKGGRGASSSSSSNAGAGPPAAAVPVQQQQQALPAARQQQQPAAAGNGPAPAVSVIASSQQQQQQQAGKPSSGPGLAGMQLLAMLKKQQATARGGQQQPPAAAAASANDADDQQQTPLREGDSVVGQQQQQQQQQVRRLQVKVVPRPQQQQQQQQQQVKRLLQVKVVPRPQQQQQQVVQPPAADKIPATSQQPQQQQQQPAVPTAVAVASKPTNIAYNIAQTLPASANNNRDNPRDSNAGDLNPGDHDLFTDHDRSQIVKPRTPPAGAGSSLLATRGQTVIQARLPDGTRGFTMGRGQRLNPVAAASGPAAPGSSSSNGVVVQPAAAAVDRGRSDVSRSPPVILNGFAGSNVATVPVQHVQPAAAAAGGNSSTRRDPSRAAAAAGGSGAAGGGGGGQALMKLLQRGFSADGVSTPVQQQQQQQQQPLPQLQGQGPAQPQQQPVHQPQQPAAAVPAFGAFIGAPPADAVAAANTSAASNLLRRLQSQQSGRR